MKQLLVATTNAGKAREFREILSRKLSSTEILDLTSFKQAPVVDETGSTFHENALLKAKAYATFTGLPTLADDSGLVVDALQGLPGVHSARYAGPRATDEENIQKLLNEMKGFALHERKAHFVCNLVLYKTDATYAASQAQIHGLIHAHARGQNGFGYDPVFFLPDIGKTLAELSAEEKNKISHRRKALEALQLSV